MVEYWDLYDIKRQKTGRMHQRGTKLQEGQYHLVVAIWIRNKNNEILLTRRSPEKPWPNYWECTGGAALAGEESITAAMRELLEETGIEAKQEQLRFLGTTTHKTWFTDIYLLERDICISELKLQQGEVDDAKWVDVREFDHMCSNGLIVPVVIEQFGHFRNIIFNI